MDHETKSWFTVLTWAVGILGALTIAMLGMAVHLSLQLGQISGALNVLIGHVALK